MQSEEPAAQSRRFLQTLVLPRVLLRLRGRPLRIWSRRTCFDAYKDLPAHTMMVAASGNEAAPGLGEKFGARRRVAGRHVRLLVIDEWQPQPTLSRKRRCGERTRGQSITQR
jgi:hypothetical protein